jgi:poly-beta-1,6-N-acetyl-D-glucosamine synthase
MMQFIFYFLLLSIVYCYFGYPLFIYLFALAFRNEIDKSPIEPTVSIIISVYNEEDWIENKIRNLFSLDYPHSKLEIIIGSDGSTDQTNQLIQQFSSPILSFCTYSQRRGKMATINDLVAKSKHEILIFTDARQSFDADTIRELVANFHDQKIGCVSGELNFQLAIERGTGKGINIYWKYEKFLRKCESQFHSMLGATGAIYAVRRELFTPIPPDILLDDMFVPLKIIENGFRAVFDPQAKAYDIVADNPQAEYRRKVRTLCGNYQIFHYFFGLFNPLTSPIAIQLFSHKFLRIIIPFLSILLFIINILLFNTAFVYQVFIAMQICFYLMALLGIWTKNSEYGFSKLVSNISYIPYVFCLLNFSALVSFLRFINHNQAVTWEKAR